MKVYTEIQHLREFTPWAGARYWYNKIMEAELGAEFIEYLEDILEEPISETSLNDILWFDDELIMEFLLAYGKLEAEEYEVED